MALTVRLKILILCREFMPIYFENYTERNSGIRNDNTSDFTIGITF
jgi:hypothetical protein